MVVSCIIQKVLFSAEYESVRGTTLSEVRIVTRYDLVRGTTQYKVRLSTRYDLPWGMYDQVRGTT